METGVARRIPHHYTIDARALAYAYADQCLIIAPSRRNWTKITDSAYRLLADGDGRPLVDVFAQAKTTYGFEPREVQQFLGEMHGRGVIDLDGVPPAEIPAPAQPATDVAFLNITQRCNLRCPTCYASAAALPASTDAPLRDWRRIIDHLAETGVRAVVVTGGEPVIRQDLLDLLIYARPRFRQVFFNTNGTLLTPEFCRQARDLIDQAHVSLDGSTPELHDRVRGPGNYARALQGVRLLKEAGFSRVSLTPTLTRQNIDDLPAMAELAIRLGVSLRTSVFLPVGRGACNADEFTPSPTQLVDSFCAVHNTLLSHADQEIEPQGDCLLAFGNLKTKCGAAGSTICIMGDGTVYPCNAFQQPDFAVGDLLAARDLPSLLAESPVARLFGALDVDRRIGCEDCDVRYFCGGGCYAHAYLVQGDITGADPFCDFYRRVLRAQIWTMREGETPRQHVEAVVAWLSSDKANAVPQRVPLGH